MSSSSDDGPENSVDRFWGKPSKGSRGFLKGWGKAAIADKATQCSLIRGSSSVDQHGNKAGVGKHQHKKFQLLTLKNRREAAGGGGVADSKEDQWRMDEEW